MFNLNNPALLEAWLMVLNSAHFVLTIIFLISITKIILQKYSPYSQYYIAGFVMVQTLWDGCPISAFVNLFNQMGGYEYEINGFFYGAGGEWAQYLRVLAFLVAGLLYWSAYETWYKIETPIQFGNFLKRGDFKMV
jgi:hypothetical protein